MPKIKASEQELLDERDRQKESKPPLKAEDIFKLKKNNKDKELDCGDDLM